MSIFKEMDKVVDEFFGDIDKILDNYKSNRAHDEELITPDQEQSWHEQNIKDGWY